MQNSEKPEVQFYGNLVHSWLKEQPQWAKPSHSCRHDRTHGKTTLAHDVSHHHYVQEDLQFVWHSIEVVTNIQMFSCSLQIMFVGMALIFLVFPVSEIVIYVIRPWLITLSESWECYHSRTRYQQMSQVHCQVLLWVFNTSNNTWGNEWVMFPRYRVLPYGVNDLSYAKPIKRLDYTDGT